MIEYVGDKAYVDGIVFVKDKDTGYYLSNKIDGRKRVRLHRYIWEKHNGAIPKGYDIHHIDKNKDNNNIENFQMLTTHEHQAIHAVKTEEEKAKAREWLNTVRPLASEWHKSKEGREWHSKQAKVNIENLKEREFKCDFCGNVFYKKPLGSVRFCSNKCKSAYRRMSGVDNIYRQCEVCGNYFKVNKYARKYKCDKCKRSKNKIN